ARTPRGAQPKPRDAAAPKSRRETAGAPVSSPAMGLLRPVVEPGRRIPRLVVGLIVLGLGVAFMVAADLGLAPWSVLDQGISEHTGIPIGTVSIIVGALVLAAWIPLRERPGLGTVLNVLLIGTTIDVALLVLDTPSSLAGRLAYLALGVFLWGPGTGPAIGARVGTPLCGSVALRTLVFALTIGPNVQLFLPRLTLRPALEGA